MTLQEFINKYEGKIIDFDGFYGGQCTDLWRQYVHDVLDFPQSPGVQGARNIWDTYLIEKYEQIYNTPTGVPNNGDIVIWGSDYGPYGHVAIFLSGDANTMICFSQNDPTGSPCIKKKYPSYKGVLGWLRPKNYVKPDDYSVSKGLFDFLKSQEQDSSKWEGICRAWFGSHQDLIKLSQNYENEKQSLEDKIKALELLVQTDHNWADVADTYQRKLAKVVDYIQKNGQTVSVENDGDVLVSALQLSNRNEDYKKLVDVLSTTISEVTPEAVLEYIQSVKDIKKRMEVIERSLTKCKTTLEKTKKPSLLEIIFNLWQKK